MRGLARRAARIDRRWWDLGLAAAVIVVGEIELLTRVQRPSVAAALLVPFGYATLAVRRRRPFAAGVAMYVMWFAISLAVYDVQPLNVPLFAVLVMSWSMGRWTEGSATPASFALTVAGMLAVISTMEGQAGTDFLFPTAFAVIAWVAGRSVSTRSRLTEELHEAVLRAEEAHDEELARAAAEERRRIAREIHDVLAHSVSVMVVQAGGARRILDRQPGRAVEAATHIEETGRAALAEMRRLLGVLHPGEPELAPAPGLRELDALVERSRAAGVPVTLRVEGAPRPLPAGLDLAAYRVLQEGLTNALRHAAGAPAEVTVRWTPDALELTVADRGNARPPARESERGGGHGLTGMRERVRLYGGEVRTGPRAGGGYEVRARIPLVADGEMELV